MQETIKIRVWCNSLVKRQINDEKVSKNKEKNESEYVKTVQCLFNIGLYKKYWVQRSKTQKLTYELS